MLFGALSVVCGRVLFSGSESLSASCDRERKPGCLIDSRDGQLSVTGQGTLGDVGERYLCLHTQWEGFIHQLSARSATVVSGLVARVPGGIQKTSRLAA